MPDLWRMCAVMITLTLTVTECLVYNSTGQQEGQVVEDNSL